MNLYLSSFLNKCSPRLTSPGTDQHPFERLDGTHSYVKSKRKNTTILHTTYKMNPFVTEAVKNKFEEEKEHKPEEYNVSGLGLIKLQKQNNTACPNFDRIKHLNENMVFNPSSLVYMSWDFNRLPHHTVGIWQFGGYDNKNNIFFWNLINEFCLEDTPVKNVTIEIAKWLTSKKYESNKVAIACDYNGNTKKDRDSSSDISRIKSELKRKGFDVQDRTIVNPPVLSSLDFLNDTFAGLTEISKLNDKYPGARIKIQVHPICKFHIADFEKTKTGADGHLLKIIVNDSFMEDGIKINRRYQARGHAVDGTRYVMASVFKMEYSQHKSING